MPGGGAVVDESGEDGGDGFGDPEGVPDAGGAEEAAQQDRRGEDDEHVPAERDEEGGAAFAQPFQRAGGGDGDGGDEEACADDPEGGLPGPDGLIRMGEKSHQRLRENQAEHGAHGHDGAAHAESDAVDLIDPP